MLLEEQKLTTQFAQRKKIQEKVNLKYDQVLKNLKRLLTTQEVTKVRASSFNDQLGDSNTFSVETNKEKFKTESTPEEITKSYNDYLLRLKDTTESLFLSVTKQLNFYITIQLNY